MPRTRFQPANVPDNESSSFGSCELAHNATRIAKKQAASLERRRESERERMNEESRVREWRGMTGVAGREREWKIAVESVGRSVGRPKRSCMTQTRSLVAQIAVRSGSQPLLLTFPAWQLPLLPGRSDDFLDELGLKGLQRPFSSLFRYLGINCSLRLQR